MIRGALLPKLMACVALAAGLGMAGAASAQTRGGGACDVDAVDWAAPAFANAVSFAV